MPVAWHYYHTMNAIKSQTMIFSKFALNLALKLENVHLMDKLRVGSIDPIPELEYVE